MGVCYVDTYNKRDILVHHSTTTGQQAKILSGGDSESDPEFKVLKLALKGIANESLEMLVSYSTANRNVNFSFYLFY